jgi:hypothetical protein
MLQIVSRGWGLSCSTSGGLRVRELMLRFSKLLRCCVVALLLLCVVTQHWSSREIFGYGASVWQKGECIRYLGHEAGESNGIWRNWYTHICGKAFCPFRYIEAGYGPTAQLIPSLLPVSEVFRAGKILNTLDNMPFLSSARIERQNINVSYVWNIQILRFACRLVGLSRKCLSFNLYHDC